MPNGSASVGNGSIATSSCQPQEGARRLTMSCSAADRSLASRSNSRAILRRKGASGRPRYAIARSRHCSASSKRGTSLIRWTLYILTKEPCLGPGEAKMVGRALSSFRQLEYAAAQFGINRGALNGPSFLARLPWSAGFITQSSTAQGGRRNSAFGECSKCCLPDDRNGSKQTLLQRDNSLGPIIALPRPLPSSTRTFAQDCVTLRARCQMPNTPNAPANPSQA